MNARQFFIATLLLLQVTLCYWWIYLNYVDLQLGYFVMVYLTGALPTLALAGYVLTERSKTVWFYVINGIFLTTTFFSMFLSIVWLLEIHQDGRFVDDDSLGWVLNLLVYPLIPVGALMGYLYYVVMVRLRKMFSESVQDQ